VWQQAEDRDETNDGGNDLGGGDRQCPVQREEEERAPEQRQGERRDPRHPAGDARPGGSGRLGEQQPVNAEVPVNHPLGHGHDPDDERSEREEGAHRAKDTTG
jgi:hypothetical protein